MIKDHFRGGVQIAVKSQDGYGPGICTSSPVFVSKLRNGLFKETLYEVNPTFYQSPILFEGLGHAFQRDRKRVPGKMIVQKRITVGSESLETIKEVERALRLCTDQPLILLES